MAAMTHEQARALIDPFYNLFTAGKRDWDKGMAVLADDWKSYYTNGKFRTKEATRKFLEGLAGLVPDMKVEIKQIVVEGDMIAVRSELSGTPKADFMGPHTGRAFHIMTIDFNKVKNGRLVELYHLEDWNTAVKQLKGEED